MGLLECVSPNTYSGNLFLVYFLKIMVKNCMLGKKSLKNMLKGEGHSYPLHTGNSDKSVKRGYGFYHSVFFTLLG